MKGALLPALVLLSYIFCTQKTGIPAADSVYSNMPAIAAIGERTESYLPVTASAKGPSVDPAKGYRLQESGHITRTGTHKDVVLQLDFMNDLKNAAVQALQSTKPGKEMNPEDSDNPWAVFDNYIDRVVIRYVNALMPKWSSKLAGYDVYIRDQCYAMEQSLRIEEQQR